MSASGPESYARDKRSALGWAATVLGGAALAIAGWAHGKLWGHEVELRATAVKIEAIEKQVDSSNRVTSERLDRFEAKLDRLMERLGVRP